MTVDAMDREQQIAAADAILMKHLVFWARAAERDHHIAFQLETTNAGDWQPNLVLKNTTGENLRESLRLVERHAIACTEMVLKLRRELLGEKPKRIIDEDGKLTLNAPKPLKLDAAARALLDRRAQKQEAATAKRLATRAAKLAQTGGEHPGPPEMPAHALDIAEPEDLE